MYNYILPLYRLIKYHLLYNHGYFYKMKSSLFILVFFKCVGIILMDTY